MVGAMKPSAIPWWGWAIITLISGILFLSFLGASDSSRKDRLSPVLLAYLFAFAALLSGVIAVIRFIKWVWSS